MAASSTIYIPIVSPPTPTASPGPESDLTQCAYIPIALPQNPALRQRYLASILHSLTPAELLFVSTTIAPLLKRDFLSELPTELALTVLSFIDDPQTLVTASRVSRRWRDMAVDDWIWKGMCLRLRFTMQEMLDDQLSHDTNRDEDPTRSIWAKQLPRGRSRELEQLPPAMSYHDYFRKSYRTMMNWKHGGRLLRCHRMAPTPAPPNHNAGGPPNSLDVITSVALDSDWVVVGLANSKIHVFSSRTGVLARTLVGHEAGVWGVCLVRHGGSWVGDPIVPEPNAARAAAVSSVKWRNALGLDLPFDSQPALFPGKRSSPCAASEGWGQPNDLVVSGGCDKVLRVWDVRSGSPIHVLSGHTSTIRCLKVLHNRPLAVTGSRDSTLRVWDVQQGRLVRTMTGHTGSVRCLDVCGNRAVSGSYDATCRVWDLDSGECIHVLRGHFHQIYSVAFDGTRIASGGLDTSVRVWDALSGQCVALLQGHTALVCQLQLSQSIATTLNPHPDPILVTGGSDGRVITFSLASYTSLHRIAAHDSSVTSLQFNDRWLVTAGNDGRVRLWEMETGAHVREMTEVGESVWKVCFDGGPGEIMSIMCKRGGKSVMEIWSFRPEDGQLQG